MVKVDNKSLKFVLFIGFILIGSVLVAASASASSTSQIYVNKNGNDAWNGLAASYNHATGYGPKKTLNSAVKVVAKKGSIYIAQGTYTEQGIQINKDLSLIGTKKDYTVVSGGNTGTIFNIKSGINVNIVNLTISRGYNKQGVAGGAITNYGKLTIINSTLQHNTGKYVAGAVYNWGSLNIINTKMLYNTAYKTSLGGGHGGAILNEGSLVLTNSTFNNNRADDNGGAIYNDGTLLTTNCGFTSNTAVLWGGGAICNYGKTTVKSSIFTGNKAGYGGAVYNFNYTSINYSQLSGNSANAGSAVYCGGGMVNAENNWWGSNNIQSGMLHGKIIYSPILTTPITVTDIDPLKNCINVKANKVIKVTFNELIKKGNKSIELKNNEGDVIPLNITINGNCLLLKPASPLTNNTSYTLSMFNGSIKDLADHLNQYYTTNFTTGPIPTISHISPSNGAVNVVANKNIIITFSESVKNGNMNIELLKSDGTPVTFTSSIQGNLFVIDPSAFLNHTKYIVILHTGSITDQAGQNVSYTQFSFTTGPLPKVISVKRISANLIQLKFNEPIKSKTMLIQLINSAGINMPYTASISGNSLNLTIHPFHYIDYINPNRTPNYNLNVLKNSGITDVFMLVSHSSSASNYYRTYLPKIIPKFKAAGIKLHAWIFPNFTTNDVARIAAMGVNVHMDLEFGYFPSTEYLTNLVTSMRKASAGRIFTVAVDPNAPGVDSGAVYGEDYSLIAQHVDAIVPMLYKGYFKLSNAEMKSAAAYMQKQAPEKLWTALQTYVSDTDPTPLSKSEDLTQINDVKTYSNGLAPFRYGISNFEAVINTITSKKIDYNIIIHSNSLTDLAGNPISLSAFNTS